MSYPITNRAFLSYSGDASSSFAGSASAAASYNVAPAQASNNPWMGQMGMSAQAAGGIVSGFAQIEQANEMSKQASKQLAFTEQQIYDTYAQLFEEMGEKNRRLYASQDVAVGASGLAADSGSVAAVLNEAVAVAKKEKDRLNTRMKSEVAAARYQKRQAKKQASRNRKYATISTVLQIGGLAMGGAG